MSIPKLRTEPRADGWWITGGEPHVPDMGPYDTRREADEDRVGVTRTLRHMDEPGFVTVDPPAHAKRKRSTQPPPAEQMMLIPIGCKPKGASDGTA